MFLWKEWASLFVPTFNGITLNFSPFSSGKVWRSGGYWNHKGKSTVAGQAIQELKHQPNSAQGESMALDTYVAVDNLVL